MPGSVDNAGGGSHDQRMEARIAKLESDIAVMKTDLAVLKANSATKSDIADTKAAISEAKASIILWVVGAIFLAQLLPALLKQFGY